MKSFKRLLSLLLVISMVLSLAGCKKATETNNSTLFKPGKYIGEGKGINGTVKVEVTVTEDEITDIKVLEHNETPGVSDLAINDLPLQIIEAQGLGIDTVAGATMSSNAILEAVGQALEKAGANIEALKEKTAGKDSPSATVTEKQADVVVIGGGGAGLAAAVSAHQNGASVIVLEKMPRVGGNTMISGASYNAVDPKRQEAQGIEDSVDKHFQQTYEGGDKLGNPELIRILVDNAYPTIEWLESMGMEFKDTLHTVLGGLWPRAHAPVEPLGTGFINTYMNYIKENNTEMEVLVNTEATELIMENNKVIGVKAKSPDGELILKSNNGVIIATGGFAGNVEMRDEYNKNWPSLTNLKTTNHPGATGDGLAMAKTIGANLIDVEQIQLLPMGDPNTGSLSGNIEQGVENRIFVNKSGNRFVDEGARRDVMTKALFEQENSFMWVILDSHSYPTGDVRNHFNESIDELVTEGRAYKADTLEDLAKQIGINPENLVEAVNKFNSCVETGKTDEFGRTLYQFKIDTAPFYAGARVPTVHHTMGGIQINTSAQVLDTNGNVISGLYAAGEVTGGIHGTNRLGGNALADISVFGKIAGENAAKNN
ncbi:flavocytochrome c [Tissierella carlieri]|uniref:flavocytochrome c n=1 Tax=Tissierella carlieri TaxID=689904 RepID=UPI001C110470|nr:flavocytochrome c [Tissierella carlieri]MBU5310684.1 flavocytochrome c [Tissierella carlieri]